MTTDTAAAARAYNQAAKAAGYSLRAGILPSGQLVLHTPGTILGRQDVTPRKLAKLTADALEIAARHSHRGA